MTTSPSHPERFALDTMVNTVGKRVSASAIRNRGEALRSRSTPPRSDRGERAREKAFVRHLSRGL
jgi:hypothetical protein